MGAGGAAAPADTQMRLPPVPPLCRGQAGPRVMRLTALAQKEELEVGGEGPSLCACRETKVWPWLHVREPRRLSAPHLCLPDQAVGTSHKGPRRVM